ncbi:methyl-accepting chemotaxis protein, partial [Amphritea sp. 1_MG-2023]|uniref:methyl-accepting chemotaxis protein n=1 Tax=Amphritea sp. 1_MG-2023 TaxID=3062670 RepID=UPI0026E29E1F
MKLNITHKMILGFALMVVFIIVVGVGGFNAIQLISHKFQKVTQDVVPSLTDGLRQLVRLEEANNELFAALSQRQVRELNEQRESFDQQLNSFKADQQLLIERVSGDAELMELLEHVAIRVDQYFLLADKVLIEQRQILDNERHIIDADIQLRKLDSSLSAGLSKLQVDYVGTPVAKAGKDLAKTLRIHQARLMNYNRTKSIARLDKFLKAKQGDIAEGYDNIIRLGGRFTAYEDDIKQFQQHFYGDAGLVSLLRSMDVAGNAQALRLQNTYTLIAATRSAVESFIDKNNQILTQAQAQADAEVLLGRWLIIGLSAGAVIFALIVAALLVHTIRTPLAHIHQGLSAFRQGDLSVVFEVKREDEFGDLSRYLNSVVEELRSILQSVAKGAERLSLVADSNAAISQQTTQSMAQQSTKLEQTSSAAVEMEHSVSEVADHSKTTLQAVHEFESLSHAVSQQLLDTIGSIETQASGIDQ